MHCVEDLLSSIQYQIKIVTPLHMCLNFLVHIEGLFTIAFRGRHGVHLMHELENRIRWKIACALPNWVLVVVVVDDPKWSLVRNVIYYAFFIDRKSVV